MKGNEADSRVGMQVIGTGTSVGQGSNWWGQDLVCNGQSGRRGSWSERNGESKWFGLREMGLGLTGQMGWCE